MIDDPIQVIRDRLLTGIPTRKARLKKQRRIAAALIAAIGLMAVAGSAVPSSVDRENVTAERSASAWPLPVEIPDGVWAIAQPGGWHRAGWELMPNLGWDSLTLASFPLRPGGRCAHLPTRALEDAGADDALISIMFVGGSFLSPVSWPVNGFDDDTLTRSDRHEAHDCAGRPDLEIHWDTLSQRGYAMWILVAFGPEASTATRDEAWETLSSLTASPDQTTPGPPACIVTVPPAASPGFLGAVGDRSPDAGERWFGTPELWTSLPIDGVYTPRDSVWWSSHLVESDPDIAVSWRRSAARAAGLLSDVGSALIVHDRPGRYASSSDWGSFMVASAIDPEGVGCWEVTGRYNDDSLSYVYWRPPNVATLPDGADPVRPSGNTDAMDFDPHVNCYRAEVGGDVHPVIWPAGTTASNSGLIIRPGGTVPGPSIRSMETTGEVRPWDALPTSEELFPLISHCLTESGQVWLVADPDE